MSRPLLTLAPLPLPLLARAQVPVRRALQSVGRRHEQPPVEGAACGARRRRASYHDGHSALHCDACPSRQTHHPCPKAAARAPLRGSQTPTAPLPATNHHHHAAPHRPRRLLRGRRGGPAWAARAGAGFHGAGSSGLELRGRHAEHVREEDAAAAATGESAAAAPACYRRYCLPSFCCCCTYYSYHHSYLLSDSPLPSSRRYTLQSNIPEISPFLIFILTRYVAAPVRRGAVRPPSHTALPPSPPDARSRSRPCSSSASTSART